MKIQAYLNFEGRCEEAINFYKGALGAQVTMLMRHKENPDPNNPMNKPEVAEKIMHSSFNIGDSEVMATDGYSTGKPEFKGISLTISPPAEEQAKRIFAALGEGGSVQMPMSKTFFSPCFGMVTDKFGVAWMVIVPGEMPAQ